MVEPEHRADVDDARARLHHAPAGLRHPVGAVEVDVDHPPELLRRLARGGHGGADAGVVDQHVDAAELAHGLLDHARAVLGLGDVGGDGDAAAAERLDALGGLLEPLGAAGADRDVGAGFGEAGGERGAEPGGGAGDDGDLAVERKRSMRDMGTHCPREVGNTRDMADKPLWRKAFDAVDRRVAGPVEAAARSDAFGDR